VAAAGVELQGPPDVKEFPVHETFPRSGYASVMTDEEHRAELLQLIKGTPQPEVGIDGFADQMGLSRERTTELVDELIAEGRLRRDDDEDRLIVVEPPG